MDNSLELILEKMKFASIRLSNAGNDLKNKALEKIKDNLLKNSKKIIKQNEIDIENGINNKLGTPLQMRLKFDEKKLNAAVAGIDALIKLEDPINKILSKTLLDDELLLTKVSVPIGVIGIIFESRPDALVQISTLCLKSGNCAILKGGTEAINTNNILTKIIVDSIVETDEIFQDTIYLIETREQVADILKFDKYINLIIPRGSNEFVKYIQKNSSIPVLGHADGICHIYVDKNADIGKAVKIAMDSKTQYIAVCNAVETLLVHNDIAKDFLPVLKIEMDKKKVLLKGDSKTRKILDGIEPASDEDWKTEYLDYILSIKIVKNINEAIDHINTYGSKHTDSIVTSNLENADRFSRLVDSASVMINCSTRFADGFVYGLGAEVGDQYE